MPENYSVSLPAKLTRATFEKNLLQFWEKTGLITSENKKYFALETNETLRKVVEQDWRDYQNIYAVLEKNAPLTVNDVCVVGEEAIFASAAYKGKVLIYGDGIFTPTFFLISNSAEFLKYSAMRKEIDQPIYDINTHYLHGANTPLTLKISNTVTQAALTLLHGGADINKYAVQFGNNPLLLAVSKGWNHKDYDHSVKDKIKYNDTHNQKAIILALLQKGRLDVNAKHLFNGMTALHIACLRGDDPELIKWLIVKGADLHAQDYAGKTPLDLLSADYSAAIQTIKKLTGGIIASDMQFENQQRERYPLQEYQGEWFTLPAPHEYAQNKQNIQIILEQALRENNQEPFGLRYKLN